MNYLYYLFVAVNRIYIDELTYAQISTFLVKIPETLLLETNPDVEPRTTILPQQHEFNKVALFLFYQGDKYFADMDNDHIDAIIDDIYN